MPLPIEIAGRAERERKEKELFHSSASNPSSESSFRRPKIQRDRKPEYVKPQEDDDEEEEGAIPSTPPSPKGHNGHVQPVPGPSRPHELIPKPRSPERPPPQELRYGTHSNASFRRGDGGFLSMTRLREPERERNREFEQRTRERRDRPRSPQRHAHEHLRRSASPPLPIPQTAERIRQATERQLGPPKPRDDPSLPTLPPPSFRDEERTRRAWERLPSPPKSSDWRDDADAWRRSTRSARDDRNRYRDDRRAPLPRDRDAAHGGHINGLWGAAPSYRPVSPPRARPLPYYPRSPSPPIAAESRAPRPHLDARWNGAKRDARSTPKPYSEVGSQNRPPRCLSPLRYQRGAGGHEGALRGRPDYDPAPLRAARRESGLASVPRPGSLDDQRPVTRKRSRSRSGSPPPGLLKRKANFAAVPLQNSDSVKTDASSAGQTLESSLTHLPCLGTSKAATREGGSTDKKAVPEAVESRMTKVASVCEALDDPSSPAVKLSCAPRNRGGLSGPERRRQRPAPIPLNERKFYGYSSLDDYEITVKLGQGTFGEVKKGRHMATGVEVALKKVTIHDEKDGMPITALREVKLLKKLSHPHIVPVIDMAHRPSGERGKLGDVYMVEPYMDHDLNGMLENPNIRLEHSQIKLYMKQLLEGTLYLHKNRILHRDMKAANLLINNSGQLQIADFGLARPFRDPGQGWKAKGWQGGLNKYTNMVVTRWYRPPELLAGEKKYGPPIDMWGIGCILAEMVTGKPIFKGTSEINQLELIARLCGSPNEESFPGWNTLPGVKDADPNGRPDPNPQVPGRHDFGGYGRNVKGYFRTVVDVGPECADLIDKLLVLDPLKRLTAAEALDHEWFWSKPFPADPASLPKYDPSKEIDKTKREWVKPPPPSRQPAYYAPPPQQQQQQQRMPAYPQQQQAWRPPPPPPMQPRYVPHGPRGQRRPPPPPYGRPPPNPYS